MALAFIMEQEKAYLMELEKLVSNLEEENSKLKEEKASFQVSCRCRGSAAAACSYFCKISPELSPTGRSSCCSEFSELSLLLLPGVKADESGGSVDDNLYATFRRIHFKNGEYTDAKSKRIGDEVERRLQDARQPLPDGTLSPPVDPNEIYLDVIGGTNSKNRIFGIGSLYAGSQSATSPAGHSSSQPFVSSGPTPEQIQEQVQAQLETGLAAQRTVYETLLKEQNDRLCDEMKSQIDTMMDLFIRSTFQPPRDQGRLDF